MNIIAKTFQGLEEVLAKELDNIGASDILPITRGVQFSGDTKLLYKANYCCRTALRFLLPISSFKVTDESTLYDGVRQVPWEKYLHFF